MGRTRCAPTPHLEWGTPRRLSEWLPGGCGDVLRGSRSDTAGAESGSSSAERTAVNTGTVPTLPGAPHYQCGTFGWVHRRPIGSGRGGAVVVLRAGESPVHGEGRQRAFECGRLQCRKTHR